MHACVHAGCSHKSRTAERANAYDVRGVNEGGWWGVGRDRGQLAVRQDE